MTQETRRLSDPPPRRLLREPQIDRLGEALIALTRELWVVTDRVMVLETLLEQQGVLPGQAVERFQPSPDLEVRLEERRTALIATIAAALHGGDT